MKEDDGNDDYIQETPMFHATPAPAVTPFDVESHESASRNPLSTARDTDIEDKLAPVNSFHIEFNNLGKCIYFTCFSNFDVADAQVWC